MISVFTQAKSWEEQEKIYRAGSGREALEMLEQQSFDLILMDVKTTEFEELGCDDYITKPFLPLLIKEIVYNMTERIDMEQ